MTSIDTSDPAAPLDGREPTTSHAIALPSQVRGYPSDDGDGANVVAAARSNPIGFAARDTSWDGDAARRALQQWATGDDGEINWSQYGRGFLYVADAGENGHRLADFKLPFATVSDGRLVAVYAGLTAASAAVSGARSGVDIPSAALSGVKRKINALYARARAQFDDPDIRSPFENEGQNRTAAAPPAAVEERDLVQLYTLDGEPWRPSADWFRDPELPEFTRVTITDDGQLFGHLGDWEATHISYQGQQIRMPRSMTNYQFFHRWRLETDSGEEVPIGQLTFGAGHASLTAGMQAAIDHYDSTCSQGAVVRVGEDAHGIWIAGAILPTLDIPDRNAIALADTSGDWRGHHGHPELVGAHCVGVPGFLSARRADGHMEAMAASASPVTGPEILVADDGSVLTLIAAGRPTTDTGESDQPDTNADESVDLAAESNETADPADPPEDGDSSTAPNEPEGGRDRGQESRVLAARRRMAIARHDRTRTTSRSDTEDDRSCSTQPKATQLQQEIDHLVASVDPRDPDTIFVRVLIAETLPGGNGSLVAASGASLDRKSGRNWVEDDPKGLPRLVRRVARHIERSGRPLSIAIPAAINWVKHVCRTGDVANWPGIQRVNPVSRAAACKALAEWNALKARN